MPAHGRALFLHLPAVCWLLAVAQRLSGRGIRSHRAGTHGGSRRNRMPDPPFSGAAPPAIDAPTVPTGSPNTAKDLPLVLVARALLRLPKCTHAVGRHQHIRLLLGLSHSQEAGTLDHLRTLQLGVRLLRLDWRGRRGNPGRR